MAGSPLRPEAWRAFSNAFSTNVVPVSSGGSMPRSRCGTISNCSAASSARSSRNLPALPVASTIRRSKAQAPGDSSACNCSAHNCPIPAAARSSSPSSSSRLSACPSAVPCTSMKPPPEFMTTFMSVSACESSS